MKTIKLLLVALFLNFAFTGNAQTKIIGSNFDNLYLKEVASFDGKVAKIGNFVFTNNPQEAMKFEGQEAEAFMQQTLTNFFQWDGADVTAKEYFRIWILEPPRLTLVNPETY